MPAGLSNHRRTGPLLDAQARDRSGNHELLDLLGAFETTIQLSATFARLEIAEPDPGESMLIDVALDAIDEAPTTTEAGPTLTAKELAANKVLALYGRMEPPQ